MKARRIAYWVATALTAYVFLAGGAVYLTRPKFVTDELTRLGYPAHFVLLLGVWKALGGAAVLAPGLPRLKEWAYAGMFFNLTAAAATHAAAGDPAFKTVTPLVILGVVMTSWALRPESRRLRDGAGQAVGRPAPAEEAFGVA